MFDGGKVGGKETLLYTAPLDDLFYLPHMSALYRYAYVNSQK